MHQAILFKLLQRKLKFRNSENLTALPENFIYGREEYSGAEKYVRSIMDAGAAFSYPGEAHYPVQFLRMREPPLFFEYYGPPVWCGRNAMSVVGARDISHLSEIWMRNQLPAFLKLNPLLLVSGGANGVDQLAHLIALKNNCPTVFVLPGGLASLYPRNLQEFREYETLDASAELCFLTEFESNQKIHKSHFYFRNRLIAALGNFTLVVQASKKSGSLLTVHHCLEMGRPVLTIPSHPEMSGFDGNLKLLHDGAYPVRSAMDLHDFWLAESWPN